MIDEKDKCPSCDKCYIEHLGIIGTCAKLIETQARLDEAVNLLSEARKALGDCSIRTVVDWGAPYTQTLSCGGKIKYAKANDIVELIALAEHARGLE